MTIRNSFLISALILLCCFKAADHSPELFFQNSDEVLQGFCAIVVAPTDAQLDSMKAKMSEKDFYNMVDDNMAYLTNGRMFLDSKKLPIKNLEAKGSVKFKMSDGKIIDYPISKLTWAIILFNGKSEPIIANKVSVENDYMHYMK
ncbi:MAG: hypothetical protein NT084_14535 [Bacteroidetes bacterium]|jgi:hypothetical protein|nr:hypothetical protein [Bacteroidota bacterium]